MPRERGGTPSWGAKPFPKAYWTGRFVTLASGIDSDADALPIRADARVVGATLTAGQTAAYPLGARRKAYLVPAAGVVEVNGTRIAAGDGVAVQDEVVLRITAIEDAEIVLVDTVDV